VDAEHCTDLTVYLGRNIKSEQVSDYGREGGEARDGVNLSKGQIRPGPFENPK
jgi:hypothetical protein